MVAVSDEQADALRALCHGNLAPFQAAAAEAGRRHSEESLVFANLTTAAFILAAEWRFRDSSDEDIIQFVADIRSISGQAPSVVDPEAGEAIIRFALGRTAEHGLDEKTQYDTQLSLLVALFASPYRLQGLKDQQIDEFVVEARRMTEDLYSQE